MTAWRADLATTKLRPPRPPVSLVRRSRLEDALDAAVAGPARLVLVSAPAGAGKSTLLGAWAEQRGGSVAWLQLEAGDSDPARFWAGLVEAVGQAHLVTVAELLAGVAGANGDDRLVVPALVNALAAVAEALVLVVDDYHLVDSGAVHRGVERFVDLCPPQVTVVLASRIDPPFRLGRLRVRHQLAEVRGADLRFDSGEASGLLGGRATSLDREQVDELCGRTEGWAAGLVLAGLALDAAADPAAFLAAFRGDDRLVVEYLRDELLEGLDPDDRRCLLETSVLEELNGALVDAVTDRSGGAAWLKETARTNQLLLALDRTGDWFRYHHLLRDLLRREAQEAFPERLPRLHALAAAEFEAQGDRGHALAHRLASGELDRAARLLRAEGPRLLARGQSETLRGSLDQLGDLASATAWGALLYAWCDFFAGRYARSDRWLDTLEAVSAPGADQAEAMAVRMNNSLARGDLVTALEAARRLTAAGTLASHSCTLAAVTGVVHTWAGQHEDARRTLLLAADKARDERVPTVQLMALVHLAVVEVQDGSSASALRAAGAAVDAAERFALSTFHGVAPAYAVRARTGHDAVAAVEDAGHAVRTARRASTPLSLGFVLTLCADRLLDLGDPAGQALLDEARSVVGRLADAGTLAGHLARVEARHRTGLGPRAPRAPVLVEQLTERETAVLRYLPSPMSQRDIATELYVSLNTVKTHCRAVYRKLGAGDRKAAVQAARELRLL